MAIIGMCAVGAGGKSHLKKQKREIDEILSFETLRAAMDAHYSQNPWEGEAVPLEETTEFGKEETSSRSTRKKQKAR